MESWQQAPEDSTNSNTNAWFNELDVPSPTPPKKSRKPLLILLAVIVIVGLLSATIVLVISTNQRTTCLTADDYKTLTGTTLTDSISPTTNFYANSIAFQRDSTNYDNSIDAGAQGEQLLQKISQLYRDQKKTSMIITVGGSYFTENAADLAQKRISAVKTSLIAMGIASSDIQISTPAYTEPEEANSAPLDGVTTTLSIVSDQTCT